MIRAPLSTTSVLDESAEVVRLTAAPWIAVSILTAIPYRFMQMLFLERLFELGSDVTRYGNLLLATAYTTIVTYVVFLWGRAVYARACRLAAARNAAPGKEAWRVPPPALANFFFTSALSELLFWSTAFTCLGMPVAIVFSGLAIGTFELNERAGIREPFRHIIRAGRELRIAVALLFVFLVALLGALANVGAAFGLATWLAGGAGTFELPRLQVLLSGANLRYQLLLWAGALIAIEPFWVAANVMLVRKAGVAESGDDLRVWFEELRRG